jgi:hypothetical protein
MDAQENLWGSGMLDALEIESYTQRGILLLSGALGEVPYQYQGPCVEIHRVTPQSVEYSKLVMRPRAYTTLTGRVEASTTAWETVLGLLHQEGGPKPATPGVVRYDFTVIETSAAHNSWTTSATKIDTNAELYKQGERLLTRLNQLFVHRRNILRLYNTLKAISGELVSTNILAYYTCMLNYLFEAYGAKSRVSLASPDKKVMYMRRISDLEELMHGVPTLDPKWDPLWRVFSNWDKPEGTFVIKSRELLNYSGEADIPRFCVKFHVQLNCKPADKAAIHEMNMIAAKKIRMLKELERRDTKKK